MNGGIKKQNEKKSATPTPGIEDDRMPSGAPRPVYNNIAAAVAAGRSQRPCATVTRNFFFFRFFIIIFTIILFSSVCGRFYPDGPTDRNKFKRMPIRREGRFWIGSQLLCKPLRVFVFFVYTTYDKYRYVCVCVFFTDYAMLKRVHKVLERR